MADRSGRLILRAGWAAACAVAALVLIPVAAVMIRGGGASGLTSGDWSAVRFTVGQAAVSAVLSVALAIPVARALARRSFPGRRALMAFLGAPFLLPVIVAVFGILEVFGRNGPVAWLAGASGLPAPGIYGPHGVVLVHVYFNFPLATRLLAQGWAAIPSERLRLAAALGFSPRDIRRHLELPVLRSVVPGALAVIFVICTTSFAVALAVGGGPRATTVELAIYQAFRFDFDLSKAALLALVQVAICAGAVLATAPFSPPAVFGPGDDRVSPRFDAEGWSLRVQDAIILGLAVLFLAPPIAAIAAKGVAGLGSLPWSVVESAARSLMVALGSAALTLALALPVALAAARSGRRGSALLEGAGILGIAASPLVMGTGLFILLRPVADPVSLALPLTGVVNAALSLPFALRAMIPAARRVNDDHGRLASALGLTGLNRIVRVDLPRMAGPIAFSTGLAAALSMGDLGVVALFADPEAATLPLQIHRLMSGYRMTEAAAASLLLVVLTLGLFWIIDRGGRHAGG